MCAAVLSHMFCIRRYQNAKFGFVFASQDSIRSNVPLTASHHQSDCPQQCPVLLVDSSSAAALAHLAFTPP